MFNDRIRLPDDLVRAVEVARLAAELGHSDPYHAARIVQLARRLFRAGERYCNTGAEADDRRYDRCHADLTDYVATHVGAGWRVELPGLWPNLLTPDRRTVHIPE